MAPRRSPSGRVTRRGPAARALGLGLALLCGACATATPSPSDRSAAPPEQSVRIETPWCPGARCVIANDRGAWTLPASPGTVLLQPSVGRLRVTCSPPAGATGIAVAEVASTARLPEGRPGTRAGAVIGAGTGLGAGLLGAGLLGGPAVPLVIVLMGAGMSYYGGAVGAAVDHLNRSPRYPDSVIVPLACPSSR